MTADQSWSMSPKANNGRGLGWPWSLILLDRGVTPSSPYDGQNSNGRMADACHQSYFGDG